MCIHVHQQNQQTNKRKKKGGVGAKQYFERHKGNANKISLAMESDMGTFVPYGIHFTGR